MNIYEQFKLHASGEAQYSPHSVSEKIVFEIFAFFKKEKIFPTNIHDPKLNEMMEDLIKVTKDVIGEDSIEKKEGIFASIIEEALRVLLPGYHFLQWVQRPPADKQLFLQNLSKKLLEVYLA